MMRKYIPVEESFAEWRKDPEYVAAYDALEEEFALASALIKARGDADMTQEQVAQAMGTTQAVVARLESGKTMPSTRTLERFAKATGTKLRIRFEPVRKITRSRKRSETERVAFQEAAARWQEILDAKGIDEDELVADFKRWRSERR